MTDLKIPVRTTPFPTWPRPTSAAATRLTDAYASGHWWQSGGGMAEELEARLAGDHGATGCVAVANGTLALEVALRALGIGAGDEVLVPATTFVSSASAVVAVGARPVPVDVLPTTWCVDMSAAKAAIGPRTRAFIVVHLAGQPVDLPTARELCDRHGIAMIEDSAQATTARWDTCRVGTVGDLTTFSFQAAKLLPGGDGGAVLVRSDTQVLRRAEMIANCGRPRGSGSYDYREIGTNARISEFAAALVLGHLPEYEELFVIRDRNARRLAEALGKLEQDLVVGTDPAVTRHDRYMFLIRLPREVAARSANAAVAGALTATGIPAAPMYSAWPHTPAYAPFRAPAPVAAEAATRGVWLHHRLLLDPDVAEDVTRAVRQVCGLDA
nr:aminotransferase class I/II-fold pyridoxal phosphate-dependent enzyme [uncultured Actinoplanes sp.]